MRADLGAQALRDHRRGVVGWSIGVAVYAVMICAIWPTIRNSPSLLAAMKDYPDALKEVFGGRSFTTAAGYLNAELFSMMIPLFFAVFAIGFAASTTGGEEERGLLDLVLSHPVPRVRLVVEKAAALVVGLVVMVGVMALAMAVAGAVVDLGIGVNEIVAACVGAGLVGLVAGSFALLVGLAHGTRAAAIAGASVVLGLTYLLQILSGFVDAFRPFRWLSPLYVADSTAPLATGWPAQRYLPLLVVSGVLIVLGAVAFERRDLRG